MKRGEFAVVEFQFAWVVGLEFADAKLRRHSIVETKLCILEVRLDGCVHAGCYEINLPHELSEKTRPERTARSRFLFLPIQ